jgi:hypothetical protein
VPNDAVDDKTGGLPLADYWSEGGLAGDLALGASLEIDPNGCALCIDQFGFQQQPRCLVGIWFLFSQFSQNPSWCKMFSSGALGF